MNRPEKTGNNVQEETKREQETAAVRERLRVLISAYSCDGADVGSAYRAFHWVKALSNYCDVTLMTRRRNGKPCGTENLPNVNTMHFDESRIYRTFVGFDRAVQPGYFSFMARSYLFAKGQSARERYDIVHQITPGALRYPSLMGRLGIPFVLGPVGGGHPYPEALAEAFGGQGVGWVRTIDRARLRLDPFLRGTLKRAKRLVLFSQEDIKKLPERLHAKCIVMPDGGFDGLPENPSKGGRETFEILFVGRLVPWKGVRLALLAAARMKIAGPWRLTVVGDGPDVEYEKTLAAQLGISGNVRFAGRQPREKVDDYYKRSDVFCFPSVREPNGNVVLEAMSYGLPVIVCDYAGPSAIVTDECGYRIPPASADVFTNRIARALETLAASPQLRRGMGDAGRRRIAGEFIWDARAQKMLEIYRDVIGQHGGGES